ncbi:DNA helicase RecQ [Paracoccaceae bacterium GXU_MW_L88]
MRDELDLGNATTGGSSSPLSILKSVFGHDDFRPGQGEIIEGVIAGQDVLAIMPTGGGKSLCYQLPALCRDGLTLVVSPLIALMRDQVRALRAQGVEAGAWISGMDPDEAEEVFSALEAGRLKLLYLAPERLANPGTQRMLARANVRLLAVDEAHCVSQWGHDFRPDYLRISELRRSLGGVQTVALTATADEDTRAEIIARLFDAPPQSFLRGFDRPNLHLAFRPKDRPREQVMAWVAARPEQSGIVYCASRAKTEALADALRKAGHDALAYHAGLEPEQRRHVEERFGREDGLVICATVAFGMGVDKPDIRWVVHADLPKNIESYYQEIGRAGRDGDPAETMTLFGPDDIRLRRTQIDESLAPNERKAADHARLNALLGLAEAQGCRRVRLLAYFGEEATPCGNCDLCAAPPELYDGTEAIRMALSAVLRTGETFGAGHLIDILVGARTEKIRQRGHDNLPTFGVGSAVSKPEWQAVFRQMMGFDLIRPVSERRGALAMTEAARPVLRGEVEMQLRRDAIRSRDVKPEPQAMIDEEDAPLFGLLRAKRRELAEAQKAPAYVVFNDATLRDMAARRPATLDEMAQVKGVGMAKLEKYGDAFLEIITGASQDPVHPARRRAASRGVGDVFEALKEAEVTLRRGPDGIDKPLSLPTKTLAAIAERAPDSLSALERVPGMGPDKVARFGDAFLDIIAEHQG